MKAIFQSVWQATCNAYNSVKAKALQVLGVTTAGGVAATQPQDAFAVPPTTIAELTAAVSFADVGLGVLAIAALLTAVYVTWRAAKFVVHAVKGM